jgi:hypothetical protein
MVRLLIPVLLGLSVFTLKGQQVGERPTAEVERLATVTATPEHWKLKSGQDLGVTLTIKAGELGAYIPNHFKDWVDTCETGFVVNISTLEGARASTTPHGCARDWLSPGPPARELLKDYVLLKPGECRSWHTTLTQIRKRPGTYKIEAEYYARSERIDEVAALPEVHGLMVIGHVKAKPAKLKIR